MWISLPKFVLLALLIKKFLELKTKNVNVVFVGAVFIGQT